MSRYITLISVGVNGLLLLLFVSLSLSLSSVCGFSINRYCVSLQGLVEPSNVQTSSIRTGRIGTRIPTSIQTETTKSESTKTRRSVSLWSEPSDTSASSEDDFPGYGSTVVGVDVDVVDTADTQQQQNSPTDVLVSNIFDLLPSTSIGIGIGMGSTGAISSEVRSAINEALYKLEGLYAASNLNKKKGTTSNDSDDSSKESDGGPASSPLLNGVWELRYFGGYTPDFAVSSPTRDLALFLYSGGYSPGMFALQLVSNIPGIGLTSSTTDSTSSTSSNPFIQIGQLEITISRVQPRIDASIPIQLFGGAIKTSIQVTATLDVKSSIRFRETFSTINFLGTTNINIPTPLRYSRDVYVTYVDNDLLIVRDASGIPEVLVRKSKIFTKNWGTDPPSDYDDITPPGVDSSSTTTTTTTNIDNDDDDSASY